MKIIRFLILLAGSSVFSYVESSFFLPDLGEVTNNPRDSVFNVRDYGAIVNDTLDDTDALRKAVAAVVKHNGNSVLQFEPGIYQIQDTFSLRIQEQALSGKLGKNPQDSLFVPNKKYAIGLDFNGGRNITINAFNTVLLCNGWMEPLSFRNASNIILNGIKIDYKKRPNNQGEVVNNGKNYVDVRFNEEEMLLKDQIVQRIMIYDKQNELFKGAGLYHESLKYLDKNTVRFYGMSIRKQAEIGNAFITFSGFHYRPAILIYKTRNIILNDVTIHSQAGMGIVGHLSENITMNRLKIIPTEGRYASTNTDATHFSTNRGLIRFDNCEFGGQGDDATNVHTYYAIISDNDQQKRKCTINVDRKAYTHSSYLDEPQPGDVLAIVDRKTLQEIGYVRVRRYWPFPLHDNIRIEYDGEMPNDINNYYIINITTTPRLEFVNCKIRSHRARSVLVKTRKVLISDNEFVGTTGTAIHVGVEGDWGEGPASEDVIIRNNRFVNCGLGGPNDGTLDGASAIALHVKAPNTNVAGLHKRILITNNIIKGGNHAIVIKGSVDVTVQENKFFQIQGEPIVVEASNRFKVQGIKSPIANNSNNELPQLPDLNE